MMKKFDILRQNPLSGLKALYARRPYTAVFLALSSLAFAVYTCLENALAYDAPEAVPFLLFEDLFLVLLLVSVGVIFTENTFPKLRGVKKAAAMLPALLIGFVLAAAAVYGIFLPAPCLSAFLDDRLGSFRSAYLLGYLIVAAALTLWSCWRNSGVADFSAYALRVFIRIALDGLVLIVVLIGFVLLNAIVMTLLWHDVDIVTAPLVCLVIGLWFCPGVLCTLLNGGDEPPRFAVNLVRRVLLGLCAAAYVILFVYMLKILVTRTFPKNTVFGICAALFYISTPVALMSLSDAESDLWQRLARILPPLFLPFAAMQVLSIGMRIAQYGLTTSRYVAVAQILFECVFCVCYIFHRRSISRMLPVIALMTGLCLLVPKLNCGTLPDILQAKTLRAGLTGDIELLSERETTRLRAAIGYDGSVGSQKRWRDAYFSAEEQDKIELLRDRLNAEKKQATQTKHIYLNTPSPYPLSLEGYRQLYGITIDCSLRSDVDGTLDLSAIPLEANGEGTVLPEGLQTVDLSAMIEKALAMEVETPGVHHDCDPELILPDGSLLRFASFRMHVNAYSGDVRSIYASALLLVK